MGASRWRFAGFPGTKDRFQSRAWRGGFQKLCEVCYKSIQRLCWPRLQHARNKSLFKTSDDKIIAVDCKMNLDENALMRHPDLAAMRDITEEDPTEVEAGQYNLNFVKLDGNVGCMVNGAGLAMATMDMIKLSGGSPLTFSMWVEPRMRRLLKPGFV